MRPNEFAVEYLTACVHCRRAAEMVVKSCYSHVLRKRDDTREWIHDFREGDRYTHAYCLASKLRDSNG